MARLPGALLFVSILAAVAVAQNQPAQKAQTAKTPSLSMPMVAPVFLEDAEFTSTVTLVNDAIQDLTARVLVLDQHGAAAAQKELKLPGHTSLPVRIHDLLEKVGSAVTTGSVIVIPQPMPGMPIGGQLSITSRAGSVPSYIEELLMPDEKTTPGMFRTSALAVKGSPIIALKSLAQITQMVTLECFSEKAAPTKGTVQLPSGESMLVAACDVSQTGRTALSTVMSDDPAVDRGAVGVAISTTAPSGDLIGYGFAAYRDDRGPYFTSLNLTDPAAMVSSSTIFTGIPVGPTELLQRTSFKPKLAISNFSTKPANVSVTMAATTNGKTKAQVVQTLLLAPHSSKTVTLATQGDPGMTNSLVVHSSLPPGEVVSQFVAWGDSLLRTVEMQAKDNDSIQNGGGHPWSIEHGTNSTLFWFNHSTDGPKEFDVLIGNGKQLWVNKYMLAPMETKAININDIVQRQIPDKNGVVLSKDILTGQVGWWTRRARWGKGRLMVSEPQSGLARSFSCGTCAGLCSGATVYPDDSASMPIGFTSSLGAASFYQCLKNCLVCGGTPQGPIDEIPTWSSLNTSIATLHSGLHSPTASFQGVAPGFTSGKVQAIDEGCTAVGSGPLTVFNVGVLAENGNYILVGSDSHVTAPNLFQVTNQAHNGPPQPSGGTCCAASSDPSDGVTQTEGPPNNLYEFRFQTLDQSTTVGDRTLTFEYDLSGGGATSVQAHVTARQFAYLTNSSPPNNCVLNGGKYGYDYTYVYTPFTHPDNQSISPGIAEGAPITETVTPQSGGTVCTSYSETGDGSLNGNGQFSDHLRLCSNSPIPACDKKYTQVIKVAGYPQTTLGARTNTLEFTNTQLNYTNQGPTQ